MDPNKETEEINHFPSFFDDFIEDNVLLELIHTETSIHKIGCYLKWKCERIKRNRSCKSDFCIRNILNNEDCSLLTKKTALHYALMCQETNREFINCLKWFDEKLGTVDLNNCRKTLEIYSIAEVIIEVKYETAEEILVHIHVDRLKIWLFNVTQLKFNTECLSNVPSHFLKYLNEVVSSEQDFINDIVAHLISQNNLDFLCVLFESELTQLSTAACFQKEELWKLIQNHIDDVNTTKRKQSRYMLFKTIEFYKTNDLLTVPDILRAESFQHWDSYFILLDISKEKQLHLILPTLKLLKAIINLQLTWQICLYKLLLKHSQLSVVYKTLEHIFTLKFKLTSEHRELLRNVLNALNKYEYSNLCLRVFDKFGIFCCEFDELCRDMLFDEFLEINWNPAACWCFLKSVSPILYKIQHCTFQKYLVCYGHFLIHT
ncbi:hypothetical protein HHI36_000314 [Cryptolaemus montrouzieri]|uniref:Uncharacterized protein n=1 Tax=Cryptolaemus montrouzieri TaxID=559131 RepID=A0ABD2P4C6_9CUCU